MIRSITKTVPRTTLHITHLKPLTHNLRPLIPLIPLTPRRNFFFGGGGPFELYNRKPTITQRIFNTIPVPLKVLSIFTGSAALLFFVATPLLIIAGPPIALGVWWYGRKIRKIQNDLYNQRWSNLGTYHLNFNEEHGSNINTGRMPTKARDRIIQSLELNEQNIATDLGYKSLDMSQIKFTPVESIHQDFKGSSQGFKEEMDVSSYGLLDSFYGDRIADVVIVTHRELNSNSNDAKIRIELTALGFPSKRYILEADGYSEDTVIEVKGH